LAEAVAAQLGRRAMLYAITIHVKNYDPPLWSA
jgi:hypothetical protein